jgi:NAD(P)-dependent dehydrogenase (short-subunit alcohol dehydrogenase family)
MKHSRRRRLMPYFCSTRVVFKLLILQGGTYLLAKLLQPQIEAAGDQGRIIITSSGTYLKHTHTHTRNRNMVVCVLARSFFVHPVQVDWFGGRHFCAWNHPCGKTSPTNNSHTHNDICIRSKTHPGGMYNFKLPSWDVLTSQNEKVPYDGNSAYAFAKRGQVLLAERWATEFPNIVTVTCHPGWSVTPAVEEAYGDAKKYLAPMRSPWQGAEGICWLLGTNRQNLTSGAFYLDRTIQTKHLAGPFFTEGSYTKNTPQEVDEFMQKLKQVAGI